MAIICVEGNVKITIEQNEFKLKQLLQLLVGKYLSKETFITV